MASRGGNYNTEKSRKKDGFETTFNELLKVLRSLRLGLEFRISWFGCILLRVSS